MDRSTYQKRYRQEYKDQAKRVNLTFSMAEFRDVSRGAKGAGVPIAAYVKRCALEAHHQSANACLPEEVLEQLGDLERVIRTIANNMNQMAHHSNRIKDVLDANEPFVYIQSLEAELRRAIANVQQHSTERQTGDDP